MSQSLRPITSLLLAVALLLIGNGLQFTLLPLRGSLQGFGAMALGVIASAYYVGFVGGCWLGPRLIVRAGHIRAFAAAVAVAAAVAIAYALAPTPVAWVLFRLVTGFCLAAIYLVIESWLNDQATNETRGLVMSAYIGVNFAALTAGQFIVMLYPIEDGGGFMLAAMLMSLAIVPVALTRSAQPAPITLVQFQPGRLFAAAPVALVASFMIGLATGAFWGLGALSASGRGLDVSEVARFMGVAVLAGALGQWPLGRLSDRVDRRLVLAAVLGMGAAASLALALVEAHGLLLLMLAALFGAMMLPSYSLAAAHGYDKTPNNEMVATAATILLLNGVGAAIGPLAASAVMARLGPGSLFLFTAGVLAVLALYVLYRVRVMAPLPQPEKTDFDIVATAPVGTVVTLDPPEPPPDDERGLAIVEELTPEPPEPSERPMETDGAR